MSTKTINDDMFRALGIFIESLRPYVIDRIQKQEGKNWEKAYYGTLYPEQQKLWDKGLKSGSTPESLIDFGNLKGFALAYKPLLTRDFQTKAMNLPTWFDDIAGVRNKCQHYTPLDKEEASHAYTTMLIILDILGMKEAAEEIKALRDGEPAARKTVKAKKTGPAGTVPWFRNVQPHLDIRQGHLDESLFAANLAEVAQDNGREVYKNPLVFFSKTHPTAGLKAVLKRVVTGLSGSKAVENRVLSLQTNFGGGKTHVLIALLHYVSLGKKVKDSGYTQELAAAVGVPDFDRANVAVFTNTTNDPTQGRTEGDVTLRTLWGELAWQLGAAAGKPELYDIIRPNDESRTAPKGLFTKVLEKAAPCLILIDELADYCVAASGVQVAGSTLADQTISFMQELSEAVSRVDRCVMVATLPASAMEVANSPGAADILSSLEGRLARVGADSKPVTQEEISEVIRRRLFETIIDEEAMGESVASYMSLYQELSSELPSDAVKAGYRERLMKSYPFHPELIDMFSLRWAGNPDFQRTRGVLRILASIVADLWRRQDSLPGTNAFIHTSDVNFQSLDALSGQLKKLYGNGYDAVIAADVAGNASNAFKIDSQKTDFQKYGIARGVAATILLGSFGGSGMNKGIGIDEIKLAVVQPGSFNHNSVNGALDALEGSAHYLYYSSAGTPVKRYWFYTKPNLNILINQARHDVAPTKVHGEIIDRLKERVVNISAFNVLVAPTGDIPEQTRPTIVILGPEYRVNPANINSTTRPVIERIATKRGNIERIYRNTIIFLVCSEPGYAKLQGDVTEYLACKQIRDDYQHQLETDQKEDLRQRINDTLRQAVRSLVSAYAVVVKHSSMEGIRSIVLKHFSDSMDVQINGNLLQALKDEEWYLDSVGLNTLRRYKLLPEGEGAVKARDIFEAFIRFDDKPMISGAGAVQSSLTKYCLNGELVIASGDGNEFNRMYYKQTVPYFEVNDTSYWILDKSRYIPEKPAAGGETAPGAGEPGAEVTGTPVPMPEPAEKVYKALTISGKVDIANYHQVFTSFVHPLAKNGVEIEIRIRGRSTAEFPITETSDQYRITKESAKQLGLDFEAKE